MSFILTSNRMDKVIYTTLTLYYYTHIQYITVCIVDILVSEYKFCRPERSPNPHLKHIEASSNTKFETNGHRRRNISDSFIDIVFVFDQVRNQWTKKEKFIDILVVFDQVRNQCCYTLRKLIFMIQ